MAARSLLPGASAATGLAFNWPWGDAETESHRLPNLAGNGRFGRLTLQTRYPYRLSSVTLSFSL